MARKSSVSLPLTLIGNIIQCSLYRADFYPRLYCLFPPLRARQSWMSHYLATKAPRNEYWLPQGYLCSDSQHIYRRRFDYNPGPDRCRSLAQIAREKKLTIRAGNLRKRARQIGKCWREWERKEARPGINCGEICLFLDQQGAASYIPSRSTERRTRAVPKSASSLQDTHTHTRACALTQPRSSIIKI